METVRTTIDTTTVISEEDFQYFDEDGMPIEMYTEDREIKYKDLVLKLDVPAGTIVTKDMFVESGDETTDSH